MPNNYKLFNLLLSTFQTDLSSINKYLFPWMFILKFYQLNKAIMKHWIAIYTKPRHEKTTAAALEEKGFETYLPIVRERRKWSDRKKWVDLPLFKSYMFVRCKPKNGLFVLQTPGVVKLIKFGGDIAIVHPETIKALRLMIEGGYNPTPIDFFIVGDKVEVQEGPMKGIEGEVVRVDKDDRLVVRVDAIQHSVSVQINRGFLKPIKSS